MIRKKKKDEEEWDLSNLPPNWTVDDIEARAPQRIKDIKQLHRLLLDMPEHTDYTPEFFLTLTYDQRVSAKTRLQKLVDSGRLKSFTLHTETPARADFMDAIIEMLEKGK